MHIVSHGFYISVFINWIVSLLCVVMQRFLCKFVRQCLVMFNNSEIGCYFGSDTSNCHGSCFVAEQEEKGSTLTHSPVARSILRWQRLWMEGYFFVLVVWRLVLVVVLWNIWNKKRSHGEHSAVFVRTCVRGCFVVFWCSPVNSGTKIAELRISREGQWKGKPLPRAGVWTRNFPFHSHRIRTGCSRYRFPYFPNYIVYNITVCFFYSPSRHRLRKISVRRYEFKMNPSCKGDGEHGSSRNFAITEVNATFPCYDVQE